MKIIMTHESTINAIGKQRNANRKEVFCITDGKIYASVVDAAETIGVTGAAISRHLTGIAHTCTGKKFCFAKDVAEHLEEISESMQNRYKMYEDVVSEEELNALRKELAKYKEREQKRQRIKELEAEIEKLKGEL